MKKIWFMLAMMVCVLASCSDGGSEDPVNPTPKPEEVKTEITIDSGIISNGLSFGVTEGEQSISFSVNANWTLSVASTTSGATWCKASTTSGGKGSATVKFTVEENTGYDDRSVSVTIKAGTVSKTFTITQKGADALLVTTTKYEVAQEGGQIEIEVKANISYQMEIAEDAKSWITEVESKGRALTTTKHKLNIAMNEDAEKREGEIAFKSGDKVETVKVYQAGGVILLLSQNEYNVSDKGDVISVDIKSNIDFGVQMPDVDWISDEASSRGMSSHTLKYIVSANETYDSRSAEIIFYDKNNDLKDTLKVIQAQKDAIIVAKNEYTIEATGEELKFEVNTNVDFEVSTSVDWIKQNIESRGLEAKPLSFVIDENTSDEPREGLITISSGELKQEIKVSQKAKTVFSLSETEFNIASEGGEIKVEVSTNSEYTITMPEVDWLKESESRATSTFTHTFIVTANESYDNRSAEIIFYDKNSELKDTLKVVQAQKDAIVISQKTFDVKPEGETIEVKLSANIDFEVTMPKVDWITLVESRSLKEHTLCFKIAENKDKLNRTARIVFSNKESMLSDTLSVRQLNDYGHYECIGYTNGLYATVELYKAGVLKHFVETYMAKKSWNDYAVDLTKLTVVGSINGDDIKILNKLHRANHALSFELDLSDATIVEGGEYYYSHYVSTGIHTQEKVEYYTKDNVIGSYMFAESNATAITLPKSATAINSYAFYESKMTNVKTSDGITSIRNSAFSKSPVLRSIHIGNGVTSIGDFAFSKCPALMTVHIGNGVTSIGDYAFSECSGLREIKIPNNVTEIGGDAFSGCSNLTEIVISDNVTEIKVGTFEYCSALTKIVIPDKVKEIGHSAFKNCFSLTEIIIPDNVTSIEHEAFSGCSSLKNVYIGKGVTSIAQEAFAQTGIKKCYCYAAIPPNIYISEKSDVFSKMEETFYGIPKATLYVPTENLSAYQSSEWAKCFTIKTMD